MEHEGKRTLDYGDGRKKGGRGRDRRRARQARRSLRTSRTERVKRESNTHIDLVPVPNEKHE